MVGYWRWRFWQFLTIGRLVTAAIVVAWAVVVLLWIHPA